MSGPSKTSSQAWKPPTHFEEYRVLSPLSKGGMGEVFLGHDTLLDRAVAIKFIGAQRPDEKTREQFLTEARAAARLQHPNVVSIYRVGEWGGRPYIISEYVRGQTLNSLPAPMEWHRVLDLGIGLSSGLAAAHRSGVLHRDIKPSNAIISLNGEVKLLDFGLAEFIEGSAANLARPAVPPAPPPSAPPLASPGDAAPSAESDAAASPQLVAGVRADGSDYNIASYSGWLDEVTDKRKAATGLTPKIVGTPHYMAPEIWRGEPSTRQSDIYAMGSLLFELLAGSPPHYDPTATLEDLRDAATGRDAPPLVDLVPGIDPRLSAVVARCMGRNAAGRYASGDELRAALEELRPNDTKNIVPEGNPYRGLFAFEAEHRALFFGRTNEIGTVIERLRTEPFILVAADSGIGKSSLCRAGILPLISDGALAGGRDWQVVSFVPGRAPLLSLSTALAPLFDVSEVTIAEMLRAEPTGLGRELHKQLGDELGVVIFIDQLEELVTISDPDEVNLVGQALGRLSQRIPGVRLLMTARSDFLARIATVPALGDELSRALYFLRPMYAEKIRQAIVGPARKKSVRFESEALVDALINETAKTDGGLPLLQFALTELWDARTGDLITQHSLEAIGGVAGALARHADQVLVSLPAEQRLAARRILLSLVTIEGTRARRTDEELGQREAAQKALEALLRGRMIVAHATSDGTVYEVAHEALLKGWGTLRNWLVEFAESRAVKQRLESAAAEWMRLGRAREALWSSLQLAELHILDRHEFTTRERAFVEASEHARRRGRLLRNAGIIAVPLLLGLFYGGMQLKLSRERGVKVEAHLSRGRSLLELARRKDAELTVLRKSALQAFDEQRKEQGEKIWARMLALSTETEAQYGRASQSLEAALTVDPGREDARELLADALFESALCAERNQHASKRDDLVQRMALYDVKGTRQKQLSAPAHLTLDTQPTGAQVLLQRYQKDERQLLNAGTAKDLGRTPLIDVELAEGSYVLSFAAPERATVRYPLLLRRGEKLSITVEMPQVRAIPDGYVYIPKGRFLFGTSSDESVRQGFLSTVPVHELSSDAYLISRYELTYGDWLRFLNAQSPRDREKRAIAVSKGGIGGSVELKEISPENWQLTLQPMTQAYTVRAGEKIVYTARKAHKDQDWLRMPVAGIGPDDIRAYAAWLDQTGQVIGARLCTDREWERAARGADDREFPHGQSIEPGEANYDETYGKDMASAGPDSIGSYPISQSPFGLYDMAGNVFEWVDSSLTPGELVVRGGGYFQGAIAARSTNRSVVDAGFRDPGIGARICAKF